MRSCRQLHWWRAALLQLLLPVLLSLTGSVQGGPPPDGIDITPFHPLMLSNSSSASWQLLSTPSSPSPWPPLSLSEHPVARYGHSAVSTPTALIITHGYYYDQQHSSAVWLSDTWSFSYSSQSWQLLHPHCNDSGVAANSCPSARFAATATLHDDGLYLYGGDDGGNSAGTTTYTYHLLSDLWLLDPHSPQPTWSLVPTVLTPSALLLAGFVSSSALASVHSIPHAQHTACLLSIAQSSHLLVFGGLTARRLDDEEDSAGSQLVAASNQLWAVPLGHAAEDKEWRYFPCTDAPKERFGHAMTAALHSSSSPLDFSLFVYGGFRRGHVNYGDLWQLQLQDWTRPSLRCSWTLLSTTSDSASAAFSTIGPNPRGYASLVASATFLLVFAGSHCSPGCVCSHETWAWDVQQRAWSSPPLLTSALPQGRYKHSGVVKEEGQGVLELAVFGGESYHPQKYHADVWLLRYDHHHTSQWTLFGAGGPLWPMQTASPLLLLSVPLFFVFLLLFVFFRRTRRMRSRTKVR